MKVIAATNKKNHRIDAGKIADWLGCNLPRYDNAFDRDPEPTASDSDIESIRPLLKLSRETTRAMPEN